MPSRITSLDHRWIVAAVLPVDAKQAKRAVDRGTLRIGIDVPVPQDEDPLRIEALEVYCSNCRRPYEDVEGTECEEAESNEHLRGGPIGTRAARKPTAHAYHDCGALGCWDGMQAV